MLYAVMLSGIAYQYSFTQLGSPLSTRQSDADTVTYGKDQPHLSAVIGRMD